MVQVLSCWSCVGLVCVHVCIEFTSTLPASLPPPPLALFFLQFLLSLDRSPPTRLPPSLHLFIHSHPSPPLHPSLSPPLPPRLAPLPHPFPLLLLPSSTLLSTLASSNIRSRSRSARRACLAPAAAAATAAAAEKGDGGEDEEEEDWEEKGEEEEEKGVDGW